MVENEIREKPGDFVILGQVPWKEILRWRFGRSWEQHLSGSEGSWIRQREKFKCDTVATEASACPVQLRVPEQR